MALLAITQVLFSWDKDLSGMYESASV